MIRSDKERPSFKTTLDSVASELVRIEQQGNSAIINVPLLYPSGAGVVVKVDDGGRSFSVTDMALGYQETDMMGAAQIYERYAKQIAQNAGISFDSEAFFVVQVSEVQLPGAIVTVSNCSQEAVALAAYKLAESGAAGRVPTLSEPLIRTVGLLKALFEAFRAGRRPKGERLPARSDESR